MFKSKYPRELLNEIKWRFGLGRCRVYYIHRGAPGDMMVVEGSVIRNLERGFLVLEGDEQDVHIPYHRIFRIEFDNRLIFYRPNRDPDRKRVESCKT